MSIQNQIGIAVKLFFFTIVTLFVIQVEGQNKQSSYGTIQGRVINKLNQKPIELATVTIFGLPDTTVIDYRLTNSKGEFRITNIDTSRSYYLMVSFVGYGIHKSQINFLSKQSDLSFPSIELEYSSNDLDEVLVKAERPPIIVRNDTIEYNVSHIKILPSSLVEDLFRKLPGFLVQRDGTITVNGRPVNKIYVDGKDFFGNNPKTASKNLPANIIDKVQVMPDEDEKFLNPNSQAWELPQAINLKLKKDIKKGWFGKVTTGGGTNKQYEAGSIINTFRDTFQLSMLAFSNNLNKSGFNSTDVLSLGGFQRSGFNNLNNNNGVISIDGISFGGGSPGLQTASGVGLNTNTELNKKTSLNLQYFFNNEINERLSNSITEQFIGNSKVDLYNNYKLKNTSNNHIYSISVKKRINAYQQITFKPSIGFGNNKSISNNSSLTVYDFSNTNINSYLDSMRKNDRFYSHSFSYVNNRFGKPGRILRIINTFNIGRSFLNQWVIGEQNFPQSARLNLIDQKLSIRTPSLNTTTTIILIKPISKNKNLTINNQISILKENSIIDVLGKDFSLGSYVKKIDSLSGDFDRVVIKNQLTASINVNISKNLIFYPGLSWNYISMHNLNTPYKFKKNYLFPNLRVQYKKISANYSVRVIEPSLRDVLPVLNVSNFNYYFKGNAELKPSVSHSIFISMGQRDPRKKVTYNISSTTVLNKNSIVWDRSFIDSGIQYSRPLNVGLSWNQTLLFGTTIRQKLANKFSYVVTGLVRTGVSRSFYSVNGVVSAFNNFLVSPTIDLNFNWNDKVEFYPKYTFNKSFTKVRESNNLVDYTFHRLEMGLVWRIKDNLVFENSIDFLNNPNTPKTLNRNSTLLNSSVNYVFLKDRKGVLKFSVFDILKRNNGLSRILSENYIQSAQTTLIQQYFLLSFTYNIRQFGQKNVGGKDGLFRF